MNVRFLTILLSFAALQWGGVVQAQNPPPGKEPNKADEIRKAAVDQHQELARQFAEFTKGVQVLQGRLDRSPNLEDKARALQLQKVLDRADNTQIRLKFSRLQDLLRKPQFSVDDYKEAYTQNEALAKDLQELMELFDGTSSGLHDDIARLMAIIKEVNRIIQEQNTLRALTERGKTEKGELKDMQGGLAKSTKDLAKKGDLKGGDGKGKPGEPGKGGGEAGKGSPSKSTPKDGGKGGAGEGKAGTPKDGGGAGEGKGKGGDGKDDDKDKKPGEGKGGDDGKKPEGSGGKKDDMKKDDKDGPSSKSDGGGKGGDSKSQPSDSKSSGQGGDAKGSESGEMKGDNPPGFGDSPPPMPGAKPGPPNPGSSQSSRPDDNGPSFKMGPPDDSGDDDDTPPSDSPVEPNPFDPLLLKKAALEAYDRMKDAQKKLDMDPQAAGKDQGAAAQRLQELKDELEKRLKQLRLEEMEMILAALKHRCEKMKAMQIEVLEHPVTGTIATEKEILARSDRQPIDQDIQKAFYLSSKEKEIIAECDKCLDILRTEGTGVAFPVAFEQVRDDMRNVFKRLDVTDVGQINQEIQKDIIESLDDMIKALKQKEIEIQQQKTPPGDPPPPQEPKEPKEKSLLQLIQELKMIRAMQEKLNKRTERYGKMFPKQEQTTDLNLRSEIQQLGPRQQAIQEIANKIHKGENK